MTVPAGLHIVTIRRRGKPAIHYVYAWRGGPQIAKKVGGAKPEITAALTDAAAEIRRKKPVAPADTMDDLIERYIASPEYKKLAASTRANYATWHRRIVGDLRKAPVAAFADRRMLGDIMEWRDQWADQPRSADEAKKAFSVLLSWAKDRGMLPHNILAGASTLYDHDRSDLIWEQHHFDQFMPHASIEVREAIELAAATGLRRGDLVALPWSAVGPHAIVWQTSKSGGRALITVPLLPEAKELLARIKARHAVEMAALPERRHKPLPVTVLSNSRWESWTASGLGSRFNDAKQASGLDRNLHDLRGTYATRAMLAGLTDDEIAEILGWDTRFVARIRRKYVSQARVVIAIGERIAAQKMTG